MSFRLSVNFLKGWPCPSIVDFVGAPAAGVTVAEGLVAHRDSTGKWVLGVSAVNQVPYVLWNGAAGDGDQAHVFPSTATASAAGYVQAGYGGVQGIAHINQIEVETAQYAGTPQFGDSLYADTDGVLKICAGSATVSGKLIVALVTKGVHTKPGTGAVSMITYIPDNSKRITA